MMKKDNIVLNNYLIIYYGNTLLSNKTIPEATVVTQPHENLGYYAVQLLKILEKNKNISNLNMAIKCNILESQKVVSYSKEKIQHFKFENVNDLDSDIFYSDINTNQMLLLEKMLMSCDETDFFIIDMILKNETN